MLELVALIRTKTEMCKNVFKKPYCGFMEGNVSDYFLARCSTPVVSHFVLLYGLNGLCIEIKI